MSMIYTEDWARENTFSKPECITEYAKHGLSADDLTADLGDHPEYPGADVLDALGY